MVYYELVKYICLCCFVGHWFLFCQTNSFKMTISDGGVFAGLSFSGFLIESLVIFQVYGYGGPYRYWPGPIDGGAARREVCPRL